MTISLEKLFFVWILSNKSYFWIVQPSFFRNKELNLIYSVIHKYLEKNPDAPTPSAKQIWEMILLEDKDELITKEILKTILTTSLDEYDEKNFILPKINSWILSNKIKEGAVEIVEQTRNLEQKSELEDVQDTLGKITDIISQMNKIDLGNDDDMGSDFDLPEDHLQDNSRYKVKSGIDTLDHILGGGWDIQTLNCLMAETSNGKCVTGDTKIQIRNKETKIEESVSFFEFWDLIN